MKKVMFQINHNFGMMNIVGFDLNSQEKELVEELTKMIRDGSTEGLPQSLAQAAEDEPKKNESEKSSKNTGPKSKRSSLPQPSSSTSAEEELVEKHIKFTNQSLFICPYCYHRTSFGCLNETKGHMNSCEERNGRNLAPYLVTSTKKFVSFPKFQ